MDPFAAQSKGALKGLRGWRHATMRRKRGIILFLLCFLIAAMLPGIAAGEIDLVVTEWNWQSGSISTITGVARCSITGETLTVSARVETDPAADEGSRVVFVSANDRKIPVRSQKDEIEWTPEGEAFPFELNWYLAETSASPLTARVTVSIRKADGSLVEERQLLVDHSEFGDENGQMVITADSGRIALWIGLAALAVWGVVIARLLIIRKQERK